MGTPLIFAIIVGYIAMLILSPIPVLGPIIAGLISTHYTLDYSDWLVVHWAV
ncbi:MAG: hypothetical protein ACPL28_11890 [bacterium]